LVVLIIVALDQVLDWLQAIIDLCQKFIVVKELLVHRGHLGLAVKDWRRRSEGGGVNGSQLKFYERT
jgi:hypothetical protein